MIHAPCKPNETHSATYAQEVCVYSPQIMKCTVCTGENDPSVKTGKRAQTAYASTYC